MDISEKPKAPARPESPTTARALDFDDDGPESSTNTPIKPSTSQDTSSRLNAEESSLSKDESDISTRTDHSSNDAPPKPPRPIPPEQQAENELKDAFPSIEGAVIKAVLRASGGKVEPAFHALLEMSDPKAAAEMADQTPPPQPPRKDVTLAQQMTTAEQDQLAADERLARQLAAQYNSPAAYGHPQYRGGRSGPGNERYLERRGRPMPDAQYSEERERSFIDDDLPVIRDNIKKGFLETQSTVNKWVNNLKKRLDGEDEEDDIMSSSSTGNGRLRSDYRGRSSGEFMGRRSTDRDRYDADPQILSDDLGALDVSDSEDGQSPPRPRPSTRPPANPDLFKPTPARPQSRTSSSGRRVSFQDGPPEEINVHYPNSPSPTGTKAQSSINSAQRSNKWQPLARVEPSPVADHDPFSLGDSDDDDSRKKDSPVEGAEKTDDASKPSKKDAELKASQKDEEDKGEDGNAPAEVQVEGGTKVVSDTS